MIKIANQIISKIQLNQDFPTQVLVLENPIQLSLYGQQNL